MFPWLQSSDPPAFEMTLFDTESTNVDTVPIGASRDIRVAITTKPQAYYSPLNLEVILPFKDGYPMMSLCRVEVVHVGKNVPCLNATFVTEEMLYTSR